MCTLGGCLFIDCRQTFIFYKSSFLLFLRKTKWINIFIFGKQTTALDFCFWGRLAIERKEFPRLTMQQSRLEKFFTSKTSATSSAAADEPDHSNDSTTTERPANKRSSTAEDDVTKKLKRTKSEPLTNEESSQSNENSENTFSLNQFYLDKFLMILSSLLKYHKDLFDGNELVLFEQFQRLSG